MSAGLAQHASPLELAMLQDTVNSTRSHSRDEPSIFNTIRIFPESLPFVLNSKTNLNVLSQDGDTPLTLAARLSNIPAVLELINHAANPYRKNAHGKTALDYAVETGNQKLASILLVHMGFTHNFSAFARLNRQSLAQAVQYIMLQGHAEFVSATTERGRMHYKLFLREELDNTLSSPEKLQCETANTLVKTALILKVQQALGVFLQSTQHNLLNWALLKKALAGCMSRSTILFEVRKYFFSQLLWEGNSQNIPRLVQAIFSKSPLPLSANLNKLAILNFEVYSLFDWTPLLDRYQGQPAAPGINAQSTDGYTMLMVAIQEQDRETINTHLANPELNINLQAKCGLTALIAATKLNDVDTIRAILTTQGSKVNFALSTAQGQTALDIACMMCNPDIMALLARDLTLPNDDQAQAAPAHTAPLSQPHTTQPTGELASLAELDGYFQVPQETLYLPTLSPTRTIINQTSSITVDHSSSTQLGEPAAKRLKLSV